MQREIGAVGAREGEAVFVVALDLAEAEIRCLQSLDLLAALLLQRRRLRKVAAALTEPEPIHTENRGETDLSIRLRYSTLYALRCTRGAIDLGMPSGHNGATVINGVEPLICSCNEDKLSVRQSIHPSDIYSRRDNILHRPQTL